MTLTQSLLLLQWPVNTTRGCLWLLRLASWRRSENPPPSWPKLRKPLFFIITQTWVVCPHLSCLRTLRQKRKLRLDNTSSDMRLCVPLNLRHCDIKQTGALHPSSGQREHREWGCHGNGPLHDCQNCLIIHEHHRWASAGNQPEPVKRLNGEI